jgi:DNA-binding MarR family transcriptional regulator
MRQQTMLAQDVRTAYQNYSQVMRARTLTVWLALDLSLAQFQVLLILAKRETAYVSTVARQLGIGRPAASLLVESLVRRGLASRRDDPADRRRAVVQLTATGVARLDCLLPGGAEEMCHALASLEMTDLMVLQRGLQLLTAILAGQDCAATATAGASFYEESADRGTLRVG